jgi:hypothetical protein
LCFYYCLCNCVAFLCSHFSIFCMVKPHSLDIYSPAFKVACVMIVWSQLQSAYAAHMWNEALNNQFGAKLCFFIDFSWPGAYGLVFVQYMQIKDANILDLFENNSSRLPRQCNVGDTAKLPYCHIKGEYQMELSGYNTMQPYPHMNERCTSLPTKYSRTKSS